MDIIFNLTQVFQGCKGKIFRQIISDQLLHSFKAFVIVDRRF